MEFVRAPSVRMRWAQVVRLRERAGQLQGPTACVAGAEQTRYWYCLIRRVRDPRDLLRWYANDSML